MRSGRKQGKGRDEEEKKKKIGNFNIKKKQTNWFSNGHIKR